MTTVHLTSKEYKTDIPHQSHILKGKRKKFILQWLVAYVTFPNTLGDTGL